MPISQVAADEACLYLREFTRAHLDDFRANTEEAHPKAGYGQYPLANELADVAVSFTSWVSEFYLQPSVPQSFASPQAFLDHIDFSIGGIDRDLEQIDAIQTSGMAAVGFCPRNIPPVRTMLTDMQYALEHAKGLLSEEEPKVENYSRTGEDQVGLKILISPDITLKDLWTGVPAKFVKIGLGALVGTAVVAFSIGFEFSKFSGGKQPSETLSALESDSATLKKAKSIGDERPDLAANFASETPRTDNADNAIIELRTRHELAPLDRLQNELRINEVPTGVFLFAYAWNIDDFVKTGRVFKVYRDRSSQKFELQKRHDNSLWVAGYAFPIEKAKIGNASADQIVISLFNVRTKGTELLELPLENIAEFRERNVTLEQEHLLADIILKPFKKN